MDFSDEFVGYVIDTSTHHHILIISCRRGGFSRFDFHEQDLQQMQADIELLTQSLELEPPGSTGYAQAISSLAELQSLYNRRQDASQGGTDLPQF